MSILPKAYINFGPGESIKEELEKCGWKQEDLAYFLDISLKHLNEVINNKKPISLELAKLLGKIFHKTPQYWINLDTNFRLRDYDIKEKEEAVEQKLKISSYFPLNELFKKGWIERTKDLRELEDNLKKNLDITLTDFYSLEKKLLPDFKKSNSFTEFNPFYAHVWYQKARISSAKFEVPHFNKSELEKLYNEIHLYTFQENGITSFLKNLNETGVKFMVLSHLQKTYLDGAAFKCKKNPVIVYTCRYNRVDNFWFTIAHEIAHVLYHLDEHEYFLDDIKAKNEKYTYYFSLKESIPEKEKEANRIAGQKLLEEEILQYFKHNHNYLPEGKILAFSKIRKIHPSIIVGMLAYNNILSYVNMHRFSDTIRDKIPSIYHIEHNIET